MFQRIASRLSLTHDKFYTPLPFRMNNKRVRVVKTHLALSSHERKKEKKKKEKRKGKKKRKEIHGWQEDKKQRVKGKKESETHSSLVNDVK